MGSVRIFAAALSAALLSGISAAGAQEQQRPVVVYDYAVEHPVEDSDLAGAPTIGVSVPRNVVLATVSDEADSAYGYFYYQGRPVIVDMSTRAVVRIDN